MTAPCSISLMRRSLCESRDERAMAFVRRARAGGELACAVAAVDAEDVDDAPGASVGDSERHAPVLHAEDEAPILSLFDSTIRVRLRSERERVADAALEIDAG